MNGDFDHINWLRQFGIASKRREGFRELRAAIFQDTVRFVKNGGYSVGNTHVVIDNSGVTNGAEFYDAPFVLSQAEQHYETRFGVIGADCLETAQLMLKAGLNPCVLNMASRKNPGGGVHSGAGAQEENLFRRTNMFLSLFQFTEFARKYGLTRNAKSYPLDRNYGGAYSPHITVFRGSEANGYFLLKEPFVISVVSVSAINRPELEISGGGYRIAGHLVEPTKGKIRTILKIAGRRGHDSLVLGAFGCGAFANPPEHMALLFKEVFGETEFQGRFKTVIFSIIDDHNARRSHNPNGNLLPFAEVFGGR
jgi:uncharacterized protein (TIGR02452 family)